MEQEKSTTQLMEDLQNAASFEEYTASNEAAFLREGEPRMVKRGETRKEARCPFCGKALLQDAHFCPYCMQSFDEKLVIEGRKRILGRTARMLITAAAFLAAAAALGLLFTLF